MSKVIFFGVPAHGHINPTLEVVKELVRRGEEVIYYGSAEFRSRITGTGAVYKEYPFSSWEDITKFDNNFPLLFRRISEITDKMLDELIKDVREYRPEYIIHDSLALWGKIIAHVLDKPAVCSTTTFAFNREFVSVFDEFTVSIKDFIFMHAGHLIAGKRIQNKLAKKYGMKMQSYVNTFISTFMNMEALNIVYTTRELQPRSEAFDGSYIFVGPSIGQRDEAALTVPEDKKVIYVSLGTINNEEEGFYNLCVEAFRDIDAAVIMSIGSRVNKDALNSIPENFMIRNTVPQLEVLSKADVFVTHGGMNSTSEGIYFGVPLIVIPKQGEQEIVAKRVEECGLGIYLRSVTVETLRNSIKEVLNNGAYKDKVINMSDNMKSAGGYTRAVDEIMNYKGRRTL
ncbi:MAG: glycosyltransferase [Bacillota bacterium]|nr:glycosyltransferase [Bacillota bacterium]